MKLGNEKIAIFQKIGVVSSSGIDAMRDKFVQELTALIIAQIHNGFAVWSNHHCGVFVFETAKGSALFRGRCGIKWVNLNDVPCSVRLVWTLGDIKAVVHLCPAVSPVFGRHTITFQLVADFMCFVSGREIPIKILFAGQIGAPRCFTIAAVIPRTQRFGACCIGVGFQQVVSCRRACQIHFGARRNATVQVTVFHHLPVAGFIASDFKDGHTMGHHAFFDVVCACGFFVRTVAPKNTAVCVFIVNGHGCAATFGENRHAVVVVAKRTGLAGSCATGGLIKFRHVRPQWITPLHYGLPFKSFRQGDGVVGICSDLRKPKPICRIGLAG